MDKERIYSFDITDLNADRRLPLVKRVNDILRVFEKEYAENRGVGAWMAENRDALLLHVDKRMKEIGLKCHWWESQSTPHFKVLTGFSIADEKVFAIFLLKDRQ